MYTREDELPTMRVRCPHNQLHVQQTNHAFSPSSKPVKSMLASPSQHWPPFPKPVDVLPPFVIPQNIQVNNSFTRSGTALPQRNPSPLRKSGKTCCHFSFPTLQYTADEKNGRTWKLFWDSHLYNFPGRWGTRPRSHHRAGCTRRWSQAQAAAGQEQWRHPGWQRRSGRASPREAWRRAGAGRGGRRGAGRQYQRSGRGGWAGRGCSGCSARRRRWSRGSPTRTTTTRPCCGGSGAVRGGGAAEAGRAGKRRGGALIRPGDARHAPTPSVSYACSGPPCPTISARATGRAPAAIFALSRERALAIGLRDSTRGHSGAILHQLTLTPLPLSADEAVVASP